MILIHARLPRSGGAAQVAAVDVFDDDYVRLGDFNSWSDILSASRMASLIDSDIFKILFLQWWWCFETKMGGSSEPPIADCWITLFPDYWFAGLLVCQLTWLCGFRIASSRKVDEHEVAKKMAAAEVKTATAGCRTL